MQRLFLSKNECAERIGEKKKIIIIIEILSLMFNNFQPLFV